MTRFMRPIARDRDYGGLLRMTEEAIKEQPARVWHDVERRIWQQWPGRVRSVTRTVAGSVLDEGWLDWERALVLEALDVPVRYLFTAVAFQQGDRT